MALATAGAVRALSAPTGIVTYVGPSAVILASGVAHDLSSLARAAAST